MINYSKQYRPTDYAIILQFLRGTGIGLTQKDETFDFNLDWYQNRVFYNGSSTPYARRNLIPFAVAIIRHLALGEDPASLEEEYKGTGMDPFSLQELHRTLGQELRSAPIDQDAPPPMMDPARSAGETVEPIEPNTGLPANTSYRKANS